MSDQISNLIIKLQNAAKVGRRAVYVPYTKLNAAVLETLERSGYVQSFAKKGKKSIKAAEVKLACDGDLPRMNGVKRVSKLSRRVYFGLKDIKPIKSGYGQLIISTPRGIMTGEEAKKQRVGGEPLFEIW